jgi:hypothetical protein
MSCAEAPGTDGNMFCDAPFWTVTQAIQIQPQTSVCTSCHDASYVMAHALTNTTSTGLEACATCHGAGATEDVSKFHGLP